MLTACVLPAREALSHTSHTHTSGEIYADYTTSTSARTILYHGATQMNCWVTSLGHSSTSANLLAVMRSKNSLSRHWLPKATPPAPSTTRVNRGDTRLACCCIMCMHRSVKWYLRCCNCILLSSRRRVLDLQATSSTAAVASIYCPVCCFQLTKKLLWTLRTKTFYEFFKVEVVCGIYEAGLKAIFWRVNFFDAHSPQHYHGYSAGHSPLISYLILETDWAAHIDTVN